MVARCVGSSMACRSIGGRDLGIARRPQRQKRSEFLENVRRQRQCLELGDRVLGVAARDAQSFTPDERFDDRDVPRARPHQRVPHRELRAQVKPGILVGGQRQAIRDSIGL